MISWLSGAPPPQNKTPALLEKGWTHLAWVYLILKFPARIFEQCKAAAITAFAAGQ